MIVTQLESTARALVAFGRGILAADESHPTIAKRFAALGVENTAENRRRLPADALHHAGGSGVHQRRHPVRRDHPADGRRRHAARGCPRQARDHSGHQGRQGDEAAGRQRRGADHRGPGRAPRAAGRVPRPGRPLRQVARGHHDRVRHARPRAASTPTPMLSPATPPSARRQGSSRSSSPRCSWTATTPSSAASRSPRPRFDTVFAALHRQQVVPRGDAPQAEHGPLRQECPPPGRRPGGGRGHRPLPPAHRAGGSARHRVPLRRPERRAGHRAPERHERHGRRRTPGSSRFSYGRALQAAALSRPGRGTRRRIPAGQNAFHHRARLNGARPLRPVRPRDGAASCAINREHDEDAGDPRGRRPGAGHQRGYRGGDHRGPQPRARECSAARTASSGSCRATSPACTSWRSTGVSRIHFEGGSILRTVARQPHPVAGGPPARRGDRSAELDVSYLLTIGGDDTAFATAQVAARLDGPAGGGPRPQDHRQRPAAPAGHPDLRLHNGGRPGQGARPEPDEGRRHDRKWFFVTVMGRHAGPPRARDRRRRRRHPHGDRRGVPGAPRPARAAGGHPGRRHHQAAAPTGGSTGSPSWPRVSSRSSTPRPWGRWSTTAYGNVRLEELELARLLKKRVAASLAARGIEIRIVAKDLGYELRCAPPGGFDIQYCRSLGYWATRFLLDGGTEAMATIQGGRLVPDPVRDMTRPRTGQASAFATRTSTSEAYRTLHAYMIRLKRRGLRAARATGGSRSGRQDERGGVRPPFRIRRAAVAVVSTPIYRWGQERRKPRCVCHLRRLGQSLGRGAGARAEDSGGSKSRLCQSAPSAPRRRSRSASRSPAFRGGAERSRRVTDRRPFGRHSETSAIVRFRRQRRASRRAVGDVLVDGGVRQRLIHEEKARHGEVKRVYEARKRGDGERISRGPPAGRADCQSRPRQWTSGMQLTSDRLTSLRKWFGHDPTRWRGSSFVAGT